MTKTPNPVSILIKNDLAEIARLSQVVDELGRWRGIAPETLYAVNLALDEILTNVISYGYEDKGEQAIVVRLALEEDEIVAEIEDSARPFNPLQASAPDLEAPLEQRTPGGLGIHLARTMMDQMEYRRENGKNILTMRKKIHGDYPNAT